MHECKDAGKTMRMFRLSIHASSAGGRSSFRPTSTTPSSPSEPRLHERHAEALESAF